MTIFASDLFSDTDAVALESHTPTSGGTWTEHASYTTGSISIQANRARPPSGFVSLLYHSADPAGAAPAEYDVACDIVMLSDTGAVCGGPAGRIATGADTYYYVRKRLNDTIAIRKSVAGTHTSLASVANTDASGVVLFQIRDAAKKIFWDTVEVATTADNEITAAGKAGLYDAGTGAGTTTGIHYDNWVATDLAAAGGAAKRLIGGNLIDQSILTGRLVA